MLETLFLALVLGAVVPVFTAILLPLKRAAQLPGGSIMIGATTGYAYSHDLGGVILGGLAGLVGWLIFTMAVNRKP